MKKRLLIALAVVAIVGSIWSYVFFTTPPQQTLDQHVQNVASQLKCLICQGESVANSPSLLAQQMRGVIRGQLQSGKSEQQVIQYFESRYGERILWTPQWQGFQLLAWLVPIVMLLGGIVLLYFVLRNWRTLPSTNLNENDAVSVDEDEADLEMYREQLERELIAEDPLFTSFGTEAS